DVGAAVDLAHAELDDVAAAGDLLPHGAVGVEQVAALVDVAELDGVADADGAGIGRLLAGDHPEQGGLADAVGADHADDAAGRQPEREVVDKQPVAVALAQAVYLDHHVAQPRAGRDHDLGAARCARLVAGDEFLVGLDARLRLGLAGARAGGDPFALACERALPCRLLASLLLEALDRKSTRLNSSH